MKNLSELTLWDCPVSNLSPLTGLTKLTKLTLAYDYVDIKSEFVDISPLTELTDMSYLILHGVNLSDLSALAGMINLKFLKFDGNNVSDVSPLANLTNLEAIITWGNPISDFSPLAKLNKLKTIDICGADITNLSFLAGKQELTQLYLASNGISDILALAELTGLTRLDLSGNDISDISPLADLNTLEWLKLIDNPISDFSPLEGLFENTDILFDVTIPDVNLRKAIAEALGKDEDTATSSITLTEMATLTDLDAEGMDIQNLGGLQFATNLEELRLRGNPLSDLSPLSGLTRLKEVEVSGESLSDLSPLAGLINLEGVGFWKTSISDLSPLAGLTKLRWLEFKNSPVSNLSPLVGLTNLKRLETYASRDLDLSPLKGLTSLVRLGVNNSGVSDVTPLSGLINLEDLSLESNRRISDISALASLKNLKWLYLSSNNIADVSPLATLSDLEELHLQRNNISDISPLEGLQEDTEIYWFSNPGFPQGGPKIEGPWLWMLVSGEGFYDGVDLLSQASDSAVTELMIATNGATEGDPVGENVWTSHKIAPAGGDNIHTLLNSIGMEKKHRENMIYGSLVLYSPREQKTTMFAGSDGGHKVWLNGDFLHEKLKSVWAVDYQNFFPVTLKKGTNILLVASYSQGSWDFSGYFGFALDTEYTIVSPGTGFAFSTDTTSVRVGDTFTVHVNAEKVTDLAGWQFDLTFNPDVLEVVEVNEGDFLKTDGETTFFQQGTIDNTAGEITGLTAALFSEGGVTGTGTLLSVTFLAKTGGESQIDLRDFQLGSSTGEIIPAGVQNFILTVESQPLWDVNADGQVSVLDLILVAQHFGGDASANPQADVNRDGVINIQDLLIVAQHLGEMADAAAPSAIGINNGELTPAMIQAWIEQAQLENDGSVVFQQGIANLERLLALFIPEETALLHNYPNPFNPETWIPYQLAEPAEVTLTIYSVNGAVVRTLGLGHQPAGIYQTRTRAVHWDGKNEGGESVASGVYFYTLTAGDFNATRKMLIMK